MAELEGADLWCCRHTTSPADPPCCCDCTEVDQICDRCCRCRGLDVQELDRCFSAMEDRCRFPSCFGRGAVQVRLDIVVPLVLIPGGIAVGSLSRWLTVAVLVLFACCVGLYYRVWKRRPVRTRTKFFYMWSLVSCLVVYYIFELVVAVYREVLFWENMTLSSMFAAMMYTLYLCRRSPGHVRKGSGGGRQTHGRTHGQPPQPGGGIQNGYSGLDLSREHTNAPLYSQPHSDKAPHNSQHRDFCQVDLLSGRPSDMCEVCQTEMPPRAAHCSVCAVCVLRRDHHCVWVDNCIGQNNQRAFVLGVVLFLLCGCYGSHLMLTTVCTPEMYYDWFLLPVDCRYVYNDVLSSVGYVCAVYTLLVCAAMGAVLVQQVALVSQGVTSQELLTAGRQGRVRCGLFVVNNPRSRSLLQNWRSCLLARD